MESSSREPREVAPSERVLNPIFGTGRFERYDLSNATFYSLYSFMRVIKSIQRNPLGLSELFGILDQDIGPVLAGESIKFTNIGDRVELYERMVDPDLDNPNKYYWKLVYEFRVILEPPLIVEKKTRAS